MNPAPQLPVPQPNAEHKPGTPQARRAEAQRNPYQHSQAPWSPYPRPIYYTQTPAEIVATQTGSFKQSTSALAVASLIFGLLWISWVGSLLTLIFGYAAKSRIDQSLGRLRGRKIAVAGIIVGWIGISTVVVFAWFLSPAVFSSLL